MSDAAHDVAAYSEAPPAAGSAPLARIKWEIYCQQRALACPPEQAAQRAGFKPRVGMHSKLERKAEIQARIRWLRRDDDDLIVRKREWLEDELRAIVEFDLMEFAMFDAEGRFTGIDLQKLQQSSLSRSVAEVILDKDTGNLVRVKRDDGSRLNALAQLRDLHGFRAPTRNEHSGPDGGPVDTRNLNLDVTDEHAAAALVNFVRRARAREQHDESSR